MNTKIAIEMDRFINKIRERETGFNPQAANCANNLEFNLKLA
jgi:hypothetical protein